LGPQLSPCATASIHRVPGRPLRSPFGAYRTSATGLNRHHCIGPPCGAKCWQLHNHEQGTTMFHSRLGRAIRYVFVACLLIGPIHWVLAGLFAINLGSPINGDVAPLFDDSTPPLSPEQGLRSIRVPEGFVVDLVASEPDVQDPVAIAWDEDGRLYVVEMPDYPLGPPGGRIKLLEDRDGDGRMDSCSLFVDGLNFPDGVFPWRGGVLVT